MFAMTPWTRKTTAPAKSAEGFLPWMPDEFATLFNRFLTDWPVGETAEWPYRWGLTAEDKEKEVVVRAELPGFTPEEVKLEVTGDRLLVEAEHKVEKGKEEMERAYVRRMITLPSAVETEKAEATFRNGVLEVHLPRKADALKRRIEVKA